jgi:hypothetical protein
MTVQASRPPQSRSASLTRIRNNQRRSRARRKEYLAELEDRVQKLERRGPQVNAEILAAAQRALAENVLLRSLLGDRGVPSSEVETCLQSSHGGSGNTSSASNPTTSYPRRVAPVPNARQDLVDLGTPLLLEGPLEARQGVHAYKTGPPGSTRHSASPPSRPVWGPTSQCPRHDM